MNEILKWQKLTIYMVILPIMFIRISITLLLLRAFGTNKNWRHGLYLVQSLNIVFAIVSILVLLATCRPGQETLHQHLPGICWSPQTRTVIVIFNSGKRFPVHCGGGTEVCHQSCLGDSRLDPRFSTYRFHVAHEPEHSCQGWDLCPDGNGLLVSIATTKYEDVNGMLRAT